MFAGNGEIGGVGHCVHGRSSKFAPNVGRTAQQPARTAYGPAASRQRAPEPAAQRGCKGVIFDHTASSHGPWIRHLAGGSHEKLWTGLGTALALATLFAAPAHAQTKEVTIGYQDMVVPYRVAQEAKDLEKATGYKINWKQFGGGGEVIKAMASGAVQIGKLARPVWRPRFRGASRTNSSGFLTTSGTPKRWSPRTDRASTPWLTSRARRSPCHSTRRRISTRW